MENTTLKRIFEFLEEEEGLNAPLLWKHKNNIPLTEDDLIIKGDLDLSESDITYLPEGLEVRGNLDLFRCVNLTLLPEGLDVKGELSLLGCVSLTLLPKGLKVEGNLHTFKTPLEEYTDDEIREMVKPGFIKGEIYT